jgi:hypothetical protein
MAVGDVVSGDSINLAANGYLDILPTGTLEWVIHNIYHNNTIQIEYYDGTNSTIFDTDSGQGCYARYSFHCSANTLFRIRVKNTSGTTANIAYDGVVTHT